MFMTDAGVAVEVQYPFNDDGAEVVALTGKGPVRSAGLCMKQPTLESGGRRLVCARVDCRLQVLSVEGERSYECFRHERVVRRVRMHGRMH